jgi:hypothetical protein
MTKKEQTAVVVFLMVAVILSVIFGFVVGKMHSNSSRPSSPTNLTAVPTMKVFPPECPELPDCVYNDRYSYKLIKFKHKDGTICYGVKPYNGVVFESLWCEK